MVSALLDSEKLPNWKKIESAVRLWQRGRGLKPDGKFGPATALTVAQETGVLPIVRFWPRAASGRPDKAIEAYRASLVEIAANAPEPRRSQLIASAEREKGQAFGPPTGSKGKRPVLAGFNA